ncbi:Protein CBG16031 [Caenorhabditis briggsae]|uniref:Protein CBG16031 n=1 Tax=Caenorhabditis briggsae TaxID=6238 RepID=A8XN91_CAEBR|nr:Protein CBG16031 [Caenorhabditis briggsae]CAP34322.1 Protein CBG16031 [Caenorhabditis briggsae]
MGIRYREHLDFGKNKLSDVILIAGDRKFYVNRMYLAHHSSYFKTLLLGKLSESEKSIIELNNIDPEDLQKFLEVLYGESAIDDYTVEGILKMADMYDAKTAIRRCEEFLLEKSKNSMKIKFTCAVRYKLDALKVIAKIYSFNQKKCFKGGVRKCLSELKTTAEIRELVPENAHDFGPDVWKELFLKATSPQ